MRTIDLRHGRAGVEAVVEQVRDGLYVLIHGADHWRDWAKCARCRQVDIGDGIAIHRGLYEWADELMDSLERDVQRSEWLVIDGYSMGGIIAQIVGYGFVSRIPLRVSTYGSPAAGNERFAILSAPWTTRYICTPDWIPYALSWCGYHHGGRVVEVPPVSRWPWVNHDRAYWPFIGKNKYIHLGSAS
jgi:hypothetical protein